MKRAFFETEDLNKQYIRKIAELFPGVVAEGKVNFDLLRNMVGDEVLGDEAYEFTWVGKREAIQEAGRSIRKTLRPCVKESKNWDTTQNLYIEGDNLDVLKLLQESYLGKVKVVYIDPPYNTGNDFIYQDNFAKDKTDYEEQLGMFNEDGDRLFLNTERNGRFHSDWCSMMYPRLVLARNLLRDDGVIFISIDDGEAANLTKMCAEIYGEGCFVADVAWQRTYAPRNDSKGISNEKEHLIVFSKQPNWVPKKLPRTEEMNAKYKSIDGDPVLWRPDNPCAPGATTHQGMVYAIQHPFTGKMLYPSNGAHWRYQQTDMLKIMQGWGNYELRDLNDKKERAAVCGVSESNIRKYVMGIVLSDPLDEAAKHAQFVYDKGKWPLYYFSNKGMGGIAKKTYLNDTNGKVVTNLWMHNDVGNTDEAKKEILTLFDGKAPFDTPKPVRLIDRMITISAEDDSLILDFFSGSATTAHAVIQRNAQDQGNRKFIMVQLPEKTNSKEYPNICEIGKERIRRAGERTMEEYRETAQNLDVGFRVLKLDDSNMKDVYYAANEITQKMLAGLESNIKNDRTDMDLFFGCLLDWGLPLCLPHTHEKIDGITVHTYNGGDLVACFADKISEKVIKEIAKRQPLRAVFRDSSFASSPAKINVEEIFKLLAPNTSIRVL